MKKLLKVKAIKDMRSALNDMAPWIRNAKTILNGRKGNVGMLPREVIANWLMAVVLNSEEESDPWMPCGDPSQDADGGDGILYNRETGRSYVMEHVLAYEFSSSGAVSEETFRSAVEHKTKKGAQYAAGKNLIVFCEGIGKFYPNRLAKDLSGTHDFSALWTIALSTTDGNDDYQYAVFNLDQLPAPGFLVSLDLAESAWSVSRLQ